MLQNLKAPELILILVVLVLLFGAKRLPDAARSLGRSMRIFKSEVKEMGKDGDQEAGATTTTTVTREVEGRVVEPQVPTVAPAERVAAPAEPVDRDR